MSLSHSEFNALDPSGFEKFLNGVLYYNYQFDEEGE